MTRPDVVLVDPPPVVVVRDVSTVTVAAAGMQGPKGDTGPQGPPGDAADAVTAPQVLEMVDTAVTGHVNDPEPHPAYDDIPSLVLLFENRLV